jgi:DNA-binding CsgD family transcriptional regulator
MDLLERELYVDVLSDALSSVSNGSGCIALLCGEAGVGKTSLIQEFVARQRAAAHVLWGGCEALFTPHPLAPLYDIARQAGGALLAAVTSASSRDVMFHATIDHLAHVAVPTIVIFEDVHWADEATLDLIKFLGRRLQRLGVMLVVSFRDDEIGAQHPLRAVIGDLPNALLRRIALPRLTEAAVTTLAVAAGRQATGLHAATGGNPFFVTEALAAPQASIPATVRDAVTARIARLSRDAQAIANLTCLVPGKIERWLLHDILASDSATVEECLGAGMVAQEQVLAFRHELARRAIEQSLPLPTRQALHARILAALRERGVEIPTARLVHHADQAGDRAAVLQFAPLAAEQAAAVGAHREAGAHLATALRHAQSLDDEARADLLDRLSYEYYLTDQMPEAISAREASLALWRAAGRTGREGDALRWLSRLHWYSANKALADSYATAAVDILEALAPGRELAMAYSNRSQLHMLADEPALSLVWGNKAIALAVALGDVEIESHALNNVGTAKLTDDDMAGLDDLQRSLDLALRGGFHEHAARAFTNLASTAVRTFEFARAEGYITQGIAYCQERDLDSWIHYLVALRARSCLAQGDWQGACEHAQDIARHTEASPVTRIQTLVVLALVRARRGEPDPQSPLDQAHAIALGSAELQRTGPVAAARAEAAWLQGALPAVSQEIAHCYQLACHIPDRWRNGELAFWLWRAGGLADVPGHIAEPFALQIAGNWRAAADAWQALGCPYERAVALTECDSEDASRQALEIFERLGAAPMAAITRRKLRSSGVRGIPRGVQDRTRENPHGLTRRELQVLSLLAEGCRNADIARRLFLSEKTVGHHVSAILTKLQARSRGEAAAMASQQGLLTPPTRTRKAGS